MDVKEAYDVLEIEYGSSQSKIKSAYRKMALRLHPDRSGSVSEFKRVSGAYEALKSFVPDPHARPASQKTPRPRKSQWGAARPGEPPEQDWSKFTKDFEADGKFWTEYERKFWDDYHKYVNKTGSGGEFDKSDEPREGQDLAVKVEPSLCIGCCSCEIIAPGVFVIDKEKQINPKSTVYNRRGESAKKIINAAETCPTRAISVDNLGTGERVYPF